MKNFKIGDRVIVSKECICDGKLFTKGMTGKVVGVRRDNLTACEFDKNIKGHDAMGLGRNGHCWWLDSDDLQPASAETKKIVITSDGKETLARLYDGNKVIKKAVAKCSPDDEYDFGKGAEIAFDRLMGRESKVSKYYNGKVVCVERETPFYSFTVGKIYEFKDGQTVNDNGFTVPT